MLVFYEEDGGFKAGLVLADQNSSLQVEAQHGKRAKVKASAVLLRFEHPGLGEFMDGARKLAVGIDAAFLWECCGPEEFSFDALAKEYFGRAALAQEAAAVLIKLHETPTHFYKKGKGRYKPAPADALKSALASLERKRLQAEQQAKYEAQLTQGVLPEALRPLLPQLMYKPDKSSLEHKALEAICASTRLSLPKLLQKCGAIPSSHDYHLGRFVFEHFPHGIDFAAELTAQSATDLPVAEVAAFSIDDAATSEIDDAFSVCTLDDGNFRVGIHIAAPALGIAPESPLDDEASRRQSTVYMPGGKITMLPEAAIEQFTLVAGERRAALSLYVDLNGDLEIVAEKTVIEQVPIAANLRLETLEQDFNEESLAGARMDYLYAKELNLLWRLARKLEVARGQTDNTPSRPEYNFQIDGDRVRITARKRGSPIDKVVSELMILVNMRWGGLLAQNQVNGIYRSQASGKVRMSMVPARHEGLGVAQYAWASSPLRRYVDLVNQRQLIALWRGDTAPYDADRERLLVVMRDFEAAYEAYAEFQRLMERYWCLRWLQQEQVAETGAEVIRDNLVRFDHIPLVMKVPSLPELPAGTRVRLRLGEIDLLNVDLFAQFVAQENSSSEPSSM